MSETNDQRIYDRCIIRVGQLEVENAKLRELVRQMAYAISPTSREHMLMNLAEQGIEVDA